VAAGGDPTVSVAICVLTFRRPEGLARCLAGLAALTPPGGVRPGVRIVVVDNDPSASGRQVVEAARHTSPWPIDYVVEPRRGIPHARNHALVAAGDATLVGFVDDDEVVEPGWLAAMLRAWTDTDADVLMGASTPRFDPGAPGWIVRGGFFDAPRFATGAPFPVEYARTSGVLLARRALPAGPAVFDPRFAAGSDADLFERLRSAGRRFVWVDDAVVVVDVPPSRARASWLVQRAYRIGNARSLQLVTGGASLPRRARRIAGALVLVAIGVVRAAPSAVREGWRIGCMRMLAHLADGVGLVTGALGVRYDEYRRVHGN
jgi:glycosyltransferase involved in cell wall biosynthesis